MGNTKNSGNELPPSGLFAHIGQAAKTLGLSQYQVQILVDEGRLRGEKIGGRTYILVDDLHAFVASFGKSA